MVARLTILILFALSVIAAVGEAQEKSAGAAEKFAEILAEYEAMTREADPAEAARAAGRGVSKWVDVTPDAQLQRAARMTDLLSRLDALGELPASEIDLAILRTIISDDLQVSSHDMMRIPFTGDWGFHSGLLLYARRTEIKSANDAHDYIRLLRGTQAHFDDQIVNMRRGIETGFTAHTDPLSVTIEQLAEQLVDDPEDSDLYRPFETMSGLSASEIRRFRRDGQEATKRAIAAFQAAHDFLEEEYKPHARTTAGIAELPGGIEAYRTQVISHTTRPDLTPERVHEIGQAEVKRIRAEMEQAKNQSGFEGSFEEFLVFLRTSPQFYAQTPEELLEKASRISKRLDAILPKYFRTLPRLPYGVEAVDPAIAPGFTTGRYSGGDLKTGTPGTYLVNTYRLDQRPLYELPALSAHEAVPGHHLQIALAQELEDVPRFRQSYYATAFGEGWALYAEALAGEAGIYKTPYERFGALSYEMWRACRLIADTGLHFYGWTRAEAERCFRENTALAELNIQTEVTRYIGWPGQALGYKIGEITIRDLRREAEEKLGEKFDIRAFHDKVLQDGSMPLGLLEAQIRVWIDEQLAS